jgi:large subunit ribosomal protein L24
MVYVRSGDSKGTVAEVLRVLPKDGKVVVKGVNVRTKHVKPNRMNQQGSVVRKEFPIDMSKVNPVVDGKPTRVRFKVAKDGTKTRVAAKGGKELASAVVGKK